MTGLRRSDCRLDTGALRYNRPVGEISKMGQICAPQIQFPMDFGPRKVAVSIYDTSLRIYERVEALGPQVGRWRTEI